MKSLIPEWIANPLLPITVTVVGAGGSGSLFAQHLARVAFAYHNLYGRKMVVTIFDGDTVSMSNIGRQAYTQNEVFMNKAYVIASRINRVYGYEWIGANMNFTYKKVKKPNLKLLQAFGANFIISAVDNLKAREMIKEFINDSKTLVNMPEYTPYFWLDMGNTKTTGNIVIGSKQMEWPDVLDEYKHLMTDGDKGPSCSLAMALNEQDLFINSFCANVAAKWLWECLTKPEIDWRGAFLNLDTLNFRKLKISTDDTTQGTDPGKQQSKPKNQHATATRRARSTRQRQNTDRAGGRRSRRSTA